MARVEDCYRFVMMNHRINSLDQNEGYVSYIAPHLTSQFGLPKEDNDYVSITILTNFAAGTDPAAYWTLDQYFRTDNQFQFSKNKPKDFYSALSVNTKEYPDYKNY
jgi:hypothetical protein